MHPTSGGSLIFCRDIVEIQGPFISYQGLWPSVFRFKTMKADHSSPALWNREWLYLYGRIMRSCLVPGGFNRAATRWSNNTTRLAATLPEHEFHKAYVGLCLRSIHNRNNPHMNKEPASVVVGEKQWILLRRSSLSLHQKGDVDRESIWKL